MILNYLDTTLTTPAPKEASLANPFPVKAASQPAASTSDWAYAAASGGIVNTSDVVLKTAAGAGVFNILTGISIINRHATVATEVVIKDGSTIIWRQEFPAVMLNADPIVFPTPLKSTANTALNVACITTGSKVYVNAQGYTAT